MFDNIMKQASSSLTADQMNALSSRPLALSQINFASDDLEGIGKQLTYLAESAEKAQKKTTGLTEDQKKLAKELNYSEDALKLYAEELKNNNKGLEDNDEAAVDVALANIRMNKGISELTSN
jgi:septal ring factor EnvC (AmiA/AmiB activator)